VETVSKDMRTSTIEKSAKKMSVFHHLAVNRTLNRRSLRQENTDTDAAFREMLESIRAPKR
jgi:hypothetical protein